MINFKTPKKDVLFIIGDWNAKVGNQEKPEVTGKFGLGIRNEAGQRLMVLTKTRVLAKTRVLPRKVLTKTRVLPRKCTGHSRHPLSTTQEKTLHMGITRWSTLKSD